MTSPDDSIPDASCPRLMLGCMHFGRRGDGGTDDPDAGYRRTREALETAWTLGIRRFDHADIYGGGASESVFARAVDDLGLSREAMEVQTKCGIRPAGTGSATAPGRYDFSREHILNAVEGSLRRLGTDYVDTLLLHRPDVLMDTREVADTFEKLAVQGKVRRFGVSNFTPAQMELLRPCLPHPLVANQVELNLLKTSLIDAGIVSDGRSREPAAGFHADGTLEYCRLHGMAVQAWAPLAYGYPAGRPDPGNDPRVADVAKEVAAQASARGVPREAVVVAWLLRHPAGIVPVIGTRDPERLRACAEAERVELSREDWYRLYVAGRGSPLP